MSTDDLSFTDGAGTEYNLTLTVTGTTGVGTVTAVSGTVGTADVTGLDLTYLEPDELITSTLSPYVDVNGVSFDAGGNEYLFYSSGLDFVYASNQTSPLDSMLSNVSFTPDVPAPCFCQGTLLLTRTGYATVESLKVGEELITLYGGTKPIRWIGTRSYSSPFITGNHFILPICIKAGALAAGIPSSDLWVSPGHKIFFDGTLIPACRLINGTSVTQIESVESVVYYHVEFDEHELVVAHNCPVESFFDNGCRRQFHNFEPSAQDSMYVSNKVALPCTEGGFLLDAIWRRVAERAGLNVRQAQFGACRGFVDECSPNVVAGWAQDTAAPESPVCLDIYEGRRRVARILANEYRADLRTAGLGSGCHGFRFEFNFESFSEVEIRRSSDGTLLQMTEIAARRRA